MRIFTFVLLTPLLLLSPLFLLSQTTESQLSVNKGVAVVELFTSQGDINCPLADKLLSAIIADAAKNNKPVFCLSMHVDFWNRYGWKDPFSSLKYTNRLQNYTTVLGLKETYTPFMLVNGRSIVEGTEFNKANEIIIKALLAPAKLEPTFVWEIFDDTLDISYQVGTGKISGKSGADKYINVAIVEKGLSTKVDKGDNAGKTLLNDNVARLFHACDLNSSKGLIRIPLKKLKPGDSKSIVLFIQEKTTRKVLGATSAKFNK